MATRSSIGIMDTSGKILSIYAHSDGYPSYMGEILTTYYKDVNKVKQLIKQGYASQIGATLEASEAVKRFGFSPILQDEYRALPEDEKKRLADDYYSGEYSVFYKRDRGETDVDANLSDNLTEWLTQQGQAYNYVFYKGKWYAYEGETPIDIETEEYVPPHELPGTTSTTSQTVKSKKATYTWDDADRDMRKLLEAQKDLGPEQFGVKFYIGEEDGAFISFSNQPVRSFYVKKGAVDGQVFCVLLLPTSEFYKDAHLHVKPKPQTMKHIRGVLYHQVNYVIQNL